MEGDLTWVGEYTTQHTDNVLQNCTPEPLSPQYSQLKKIVETFGALLTWDESGKKMLLIIFTQMYAK